MNSHCFVIPQVTAHKRSPEDGGVAIIENEKYEEFEFETL